MSAVAKPRHEEVVFWHDLRLRQVPAQRDEAARWETSQFGAGQRAKLWLHNSGQYGAMFDDGLAVYGYDIDGTLSEACFKAYEHACYAADCLLARLQEDFR